MTETRYALCVRCGAEFEQITRKRQYCSDKCRSAVRYEAGFRRGFGGRVERIATALDDAVPVVWDGVTRYSETPEVRPYFLTCGLCGHGGSLRLTDSDARNLPRYRCPRLHCGGRMFLEPDVALPKRESSYRLELWERPRA